MMHHWVRETKSRQLVAIVGAIALSVFFSGPALAASPAHPTINATKSSFVIPTGSANTWTLRLWSHGAFVGSATAKTGTLTVAVPRQSECTFQADVSATAPGGRPFFVVGWRTTLNSCGPPLTQTLAGHIYLCTPTGAPTTTEVSDGTLAATGPQSVTSQANPLTPLSVSSGTYAMTAGAPNGFLLVACGTTTTVAPDGQTAMASVTSPPGGAGMGIFYVSAPPVAAGGGSTGSTPGAGVTSSSDNPTPPTAPGHGATAADRSPAAATTPVSSGQLAFTGLNTGPPLLLGLILLSLGSVLVVFSSKRRSAALRGALITVSAKTRRGSSSSAGHTE
jgi:hypothetical protein